jgi:hypothetical protein
MSWFKSFGVIFGGMLLLLLGDFASKSGAIDPTVFRLAGAGLIGMGVYLGLTAASGGTRRPATTRSRKR